MNAISSHCHMQNMDYLERLILVAFCKNQNLICDAPTNFVHRTNFAVTRTLLVN